MFRATFRPSSGALLKCSRSLRFPYKSQGGCVSTNKQTKAGKIHLGYYTETGGCNCSLKVLLMMGRMLPKKKSAFQIRSNMLCKNFGHADLYHRCKIARCEVLVPTSRRIQVYSDMTLCWWWISGSQNFEGLYCLHLQEWQTLCNIKMLNRHTESHCRRSESRCKIVKLDHSIKKPHTGRQKKRKIKIHKVSKCFYFYKTPMFSHNM
jgi:hypothetical protein